MKFDVCIPKQYFPLARRKLCGLSEYVSIHETEADTRQQAAAQVWAECGEFYLMEFEPRKSRLPRKVSLFVSGGAGTPPGRILPIVVFVGFGPNDLRPDTPATTPAENPI